MKRHGHDAVGGVEGLLHAVAVVNVDVDVQHTLVVLEQLQDGQHDVVDITEAGSLAVEVGIWLCISEREELEHIMTYSIDTCIISDRSYTWTSKDDSELFGRSWVDVNMFIFYDLAHYQVLQP